MFEYCQRETYSVKRFMYTKSQKKILNMIILSYRKWLRFICLYIFNKFNSFADGN